MLRRRGEGKGDVSEGSIPEFVKVESIRGDQVGSSLEEMLSFILGYPVGFIMNNKGSMVTMVHDQ